MEKRNRCVASVPNRGPDFDIPCRGVSQRAHPGLIGEYSAFFLRPEIDQEDVSRGDQRRPFCGRLIMRVSRIGADGDDRPVIGTEAIGGKPFQNPLLQRKLRER